MGLQIDAAIASRLSPCVSRDTKSRDCMYSRKVNHLIYTWSVLSSPLRGRAAIALMIGCEAPRKCTEMGLSW